MLLLFCFRVGGRSVEHQLLRDAVRPLLRSNDVCLDIFCWLWDDRCCDGERCSSSFSSYIIIYVRLIEFRLGYLRLAVWVFYQIWFEFVS
jgi:hypothetical protein